MCGEWEHAPAIALATQYPIQPQFTYEEFEPNSTPPSNRGTTGTSGNVDNNIVALHHLVLCLQPVDASCELRLRKGGLPLCQLCIDGLQQPARGDVLLPSSGEGASHERPQRVE